MLYSWERKHKSPREQAITFSRGHAPSAIHRMNLKINEAFTLKMHQMFPVHTTPEEFQDAIITSHFKVVVEENSVTDTTSLS